MAEELFGDETVTLTDEEGNSSEFEIIGSTIIDGNTYYALIPLDEENENAEESEYVVLKSVTDETGEEMLVTIDDDDEFDRVVDEFEDTLFSEIDYDADEDDGE